MPEVLSIPGFPNGLAQNTNFSSTTTDTITDSGLGKAGFTSEHVFPYVNTVKLKIQAEILFVLLTQQCPVTFGKLVPYSYGQIHITFMLPKILK